MVKKSPAITKTEVLNFLVNPGDKNVECREQYIKLIASQPGYRGGSRVEKGELKALLKSITHPVKKLQPFQHFWEFWLIPLNDSFDSFKSRRA